MQNQTSLKYKLIRLKFRQSLPCIEQQSTISTLDKAGAAFSTALNLKLSCIIVSSEWESILNGVLMDHQSFGFVVPGLEIWNEVTNKYHLYYYSILGLEICKKVKIINITGFMYLSLKFKMKSFYKFNLTYQYPHKVVVGDITI